MIPKFRAWNTKTGRFAKDGELFLNIDSENYNLYSVDYDSFRLENDNYILMQSTGLKDKNGVEIYEGDVVQGYSVYPTAGRFESFLMDEVYYTNRGTWDCYSYILGGFNEQVEVIGNIYENKELIEVECN